MSIENFSKNKIIKILNNIKTKTFDEDTITYLDNTIAVGQEATKLLKNLFINKGYLISNVTDEPDLYSYFEINKNEGINFLVYFEPMDFNFEIFLDFSDFSVVVGTDQDISNKVKDLNDFLENMCRMIIGELSYINVLAHEEKVIIEENTTEKKVIINNNKKKKSNSNKKVKTVRNIKITKEVVKRTNRNNTNSNNTEQKREYNRQIKSWNVRGYYRTYKSGKKVWIDPQVRKAKNGSSKVKGIKNYIVANNENK